MAELRIGTCGWKYESWRGLLYSDNPEINYLKEYSAYFNSVEIAQWFSSLYGINNIIMPQSYVVKNYKESVTPQFKFSVKLPNTITLTHLNKPDIDQLPITNPHFLSIDLLKEFINSIKSLHKNLGPLMFQFDYLNKEKMKSQFEFQGLFREFAGSLPERFLFAIEIRNANYLNETYFQFLRDNKLGHVFMQGYDMPPVHEIYERYKDYIKDYTVIRLHGPEGKGIETRTGGEWNKIVDPKDDEIEKICLMIMQLLERDIDVYLNINNHFEGSAPLTIKKIKKVIESSLNE